MMISNHRYRYFVVCLVFVAFVSTMAQEHQSHFPPEEFQARWENIFDIIGEAAAVFQGAPDNGGFNFPRQQNVFYYLCGVENPHSYLVLDGRSRQAILYLPQGHSRHGRRVLSLDDSSHVKRRTGVHSVRPVEAFDRIDVRILYTPFKPSEGHGQTRGNRIRANRLALNDQWDGRISREQHFISLLRARHPRAEIRDISPIIDKMRTIKSPREIELLRRAGRLAALGILEAMKSTQPGLYEYQLDAAARYVFLVNGARLDAYRSITASGIENIRDGHYYFNSSRLRSRDLVLMDYAPDYGYYVSDIGRMWPVNGKFEPWQRQLCSLILAYHKAILKRIRPGITPNSIMTEAAEELEPLIQRTAFIKPYYETAVRKMVKTGGGVFSHTVGMAVHDVGTYFRKPLRAGLVFAVDPQLRVPEDNLYMRIEDTIVVTETGIENFTRFAPSELEEIEKTVRGKGIVQQVTPDLFPLKVF